MENLPNIFRKIVSSVLGLERVCPQKVGPWPWPRIFLSPWPWSRTLCPRLRLSSNRTKCCQQLATAATFLQKELGCPGAMTQRWASPSRDTPRRNAASVMKDLS